MLCPSLSISFHDYQGIRCKAGLPDSHVQVQGYKTAHRSVQKSFWCYNCPSADAITAWTTSACKLLVSSQGSLLQQPSPCSSCLQWGIIHCLISSRHCNKRGTIFRHSDQAYYPLPESPAQLSCFISESISSSNCWAVQGWCSSRGHGDPSSPCSLSPSPLSLYLPYLKLTIL